MTLAQERAVAHTRRWTRTRVPGLLTFTFAVLYVVFALGRHRAYSTGGYDLGIFEQAVRCYADGRLPVSTIRAPGMVLFGDHFSPIIAVLAPAYLLVPRSETLLVAQALLFALSVLPITRMAIRAGGRGFGAAIGVCYGLSWGLQNALAFDFHEIAFAVPLLAFSLEAVLRDRPGAAVAYAAPLVLVKEDLGLTVAVLGLLLMARNRRLGLATAAGGVLSSLIAAFWIVPAYSVDNTYRYLGTGGLQPTADLFRGELFDGGKLELVLLLLVPVLFLALRSPLVLLVVPTLGWRLAGTNILYWLPEFHYDAVLMPILFAAAVHGVVLLRPRTTTRTAPAAIATVLLGVCAIVGVRFPFAELVRPDFGTPPAWASSAETLMARIPDNAAVATENELAPRLTGRATVHSVSTWRDADWVLVRAHRAELIDELTADGALITGQEGPFVLFHR